MVDHGHQMVALHQTGGLHLLLEPAAELGIVPELAADHLQRDGLAAAGVREVHGAHTALADPGDQPVSAGLARIVGSERCEHRASVGTDGSLPRSYVKGDRTSLREMMKRHIPVSGGRLTERQESVTFPSRGPR